MNFQLDPERILLKIVFLLKTKRFQNHLRHAKTTNLNPW